MVLCHKFLFFSSNAVVFSFYRLFLVPYIPVLKIRIGLGWECGLHLSACSGSTCLNWILCLKLSLPCFSENLAARHLRHPTLATLPVTSLQLVMVNVLELDVLFDVELLDFGSAQSISRTSHCTFDLGNLRMLNCTCSRVPSNPTCLRGIFHERRHLVEIVDTSSRQSSECAARTLLVVLMTSSCFLLSFLTAWPNLRSAPLAASPALQIHHDFGQHFLPAVGIAFLSWVLGSWLFFFVFHVRPFRVLLFTSHLSLAAIGSLFRARVADFFFSCWPGSWFRLVQSSRSLASSGLIATFWSSSSPSRHFRASSCGTSRLFCSSNTILWSFAVTWLLVLTPELPCSTLLRRGRWSSATAAAHHNLDC